MLECLGDASRNLLSINTEKLTHMYLFCGIKSQYCDTHTATAYVHLDESLTRVFIITIMISHFDFHYDSKEAVESESQFGISRPETKLQ